MMLQHLGIDFNILNPEEQRVFFIQYSERRATDLTKPVTFKKKI